MIAAWFAAKGFGWLLELATLAIPIPVIAIVAAGAWVHFDKASAVRQAVDQAVTKLVAGARIEALEATIAEERKLKAFALRSAEDARQRAETLAEANKDIADQLAGEQFARERFEQQLEERKNVPPPANGVVDDALLGRLHNR